MGLIAIICLVSSTTAAAWGDSAPDNACSDWTSGGDTDCDATLEDADVEDVFCCEVTVSDGIVIGDADSDSIGADDSTTTYCYMLGDTMVINVATTDAAGTAGTTDVFVDGNDFCVVSDDA